MKNPQSIRELFAMPGFVAASTLVGVFGDRYARVIKLRRRKKQLSVRIADTGAGDVTTRGACEYETSRLPDGESTWNLNAGGLVVPGAAACM